MAALDLLTSFCKLPDQELTDYCAILAAIKQDLNDSPDAPVEDRCQLLKVCKKLEEDQLEALVAARLLMSSMTVEEKPTIINSSTIQSAKNIHWLGVQRLVTEYTLRALLEQREE